MTTEEILSFLSTGEPKITNGLFSIDADTRQILVPDKEEIFGVEEDGYSERKYFGVQRQLTDDIDLSECKVVSVYKILDEDGKEQARGNYIVNDLACNDDWAAFSILFPFSAYVTFGTICFILSVRYYKDGILAKEWNTTVAKGTVLKGIPTDFTDEEANSAGNLYNQLLNEFADELSNLKDNIVNEINSVNSDALDAIGEKETESLNKLEEEYQEIEKGRIDLTQVIEESNTATAECKKATETAKTATQELNEAANNANTAAVNANNAAESANAAAEACQGIVNGLNTMVDTVTGKVCVLSIENGIITVREA